MGDYLLLIDGSSLLSTNFFGNLPREILFSKDPAEKEKYFHKIMMTSKGVYTNAVFGFLRTLFKILKDQQPAYLAVAWDLTRDTFRREKYPEYKANRGDTMLPLAEQFDLCPKVLEQMGIPQFMSERYEADDWCGSLAKRFEQEVPVKILTKDHDYLQLVNDRTHLWLMHSSAEKTEEMYKKYRMTHDPDVPDRAFELDPRLVEEEFGVKPEHVNSLKGLQGDSSDNIKGVPGIGPQTALKLIAEYGTVGALYEAVHAAENAPGGLDALKKDWKERLGITRSPLNFLLKESDEELTGERSAFLSEELATIFRDIDLGSLTLDDLKTSLQKDAVDAVLNELEF
ncbi:MAG: DNA polymerase I, partial [Lachnospiraceae bacterium]|nr:DNA polymerase I [Lachnospiraceae bacterium]